MSKVAAMLSLGIIASLMGLMMASVFIASKLGQLPTAPAPLGPWADHPAPVRAPLVLSENAGIWLLRGDLRLHNARIRDVARPVQETIEQQVILPLETVERIVVTNGRFWWNAGRDPTGVAPAPAAQGAIGAADAIGIQHLIEPLQRLAFDTLVLESAQLTIQRPSGGLMMLDMLDAQVRMAPGRGASQATGQFRHLGETLAFEVAFEPSVVSTEGWRLPVRIGVTGRHVKAKFDGSLHIHAGQLRLAGRVDLSGPDLTALAQWLGTAVPNGVGPGPFAAQGDAVWRDGQLVIEHLQLTLDGQTALGALTLSLAGPRPSLDGAMAFKVADARAAMRWFGYGPPSPLPAVGARGAGPAAVQHEQAAPTSAAPARIPLFDLIDGDLRVSIARMTGLATPVTHAAVSLTAKAGEIVADIAEVELALGHASGQVRINQSREPVVVRLHGHVNQADSTALLALAGLTPGISGKSFVRMDLSGRGRSRQEVLRSLTGELQVSMPEGGRLPFDLPRLLAQVRDLKTTTFGAHEHRPADFQSLEARFGVRYSTLVSEQVTLRSDGTTITGDGTIQAATGGIYFRWLIDHGFGLARTARLGRSQSVLFRGDLANPIVILEEPMEILPPAKAADDDDGKTEPRPGSRQPKGR